MSRPLFNHSTSQLEQFLESHLADCGRLETLLVELRTRSSRQAIALRRRVEQAIAALPNRDARSEHDLLPTVGVDESSPDEDSRRGALLTDSPGPNDWDDLQRLAIRADAKVRQIVDAGPGTGKTAVACARVAHLIISGVEASNIWLISFTRTAVQELRNRIRELVQQDALASAVRITTLDSHAWRMVTGFENDGQNPFAGYDGTIGNAIRLLRDPGEEVGEYLGSVEHLLVDEAQDLVSIRADLVELLIQRISASAGVTVLCDEAQAIYGFSEMESEEDISLPLTRRLAIGACGAFSRVSLTTVHRTDSPSLHAIFTKTRTTVLAPRPSGVQKLHRVRQEILDNADGRVGMVTEQALNGRNDTLVLFRRRVEVLMASSYLWGGGVQHRVRMSGLPTCIPPWIAVCLSDYEARWLTGDDFLDRFRERSIEPGLHPYAADQAWNLLLATAGTRNGRLDMHLLRDRLSAARPPVDLCSHELGSGGPIVGTIHASKGRESNFVHLMLPAAADNIEGDVEEETRVLFVGATRARVSLRTGDGMSMSAGTTKRSQRCFRSLRGKGVPRAQVEIGHDGDVNLQRQVTESLFESPQDVIDSQAILQSMVGTTSEISAWSVAEDGFSYYLRAGKVRESPVIGVLNASFNADLFEVSRSCGARQRRVSLPSLIRHIRCIGVRTVAISPADPLLPSLPSPFCDSGFYLAPIIIGFAAINFYDARAR